MDKKQAEEEAVKKAKQQQNVAGKNTGMSGRDLVSRLHCSLVLFIYADAVPIQPRMVRGQRGWGCLRGLGFGKIQKAEGSRGSRHGRAENSRSQIARRSQRRRCRGKRGWQKLRSHRRYVGKR